MDHDLNVLKEIYRSAKIEYEESMGKYGYVLSVEDSEDNTFVVHVFNLQGDLLNCHTSGG